LDTHGVPQSGCTINGRNYIEHALERMIPPTQSQCQVLRQKARRNWSYANIRPGLEAKYFTYDAYEKDFVKPRGITPAIVEDIIAKTEPTVSDKNPNRLVYERGGIRLIVDKDSGQVITVFKLENRPTDWCAISE